MAIRSLGVRVPAAAALAALAILSGGCGSGQAHSSQSTPATTASPRPSGLLSDAPITAPDSEPYFLFQANADGRLRGISWDGATGGVFAGARFSGINQQSPDGRFLVADGMIYDRHGHPVGPFPWPGKEMSATWAPDSSVMCRAVPQSLNDGAPMTLQLATLGKAPRTIASGFMPYADNAFYPVLACNPRGDVAIVADLGQGVAVNHIWIIQLSSGRLLRTIAPAGGWAAASSDGSLLAISSAWLEGSVPETSVESALTGTVLASFPNFEVHGFSGDNSMLFGLSGADRVPTLRSRATGATLWTGPKGQYFGYFPQPNGNRIIVGFIGAGGYLGDAYLVDAEGGAPLSLPSNVSAALQQ